MKIDDLAVPLFLETPICEGKTPKKSQVIIIPVKNEFIINNQQWRIWQSVLAKLRHTRFAVYLGYPVFLP